ncbi:rab11 family-interacting protein 5 isoform X1 [Salmo trutta]|uniref:Rab11 family-interacting protein 5-like n=1 Tax=Salmo trutta TaxID=8032 RepID=A0A674CY46_SALTR|nr:rab11 family-interacting protein 5-like isoform X1 [Salmo trutta]
MSSLNIDDDDQRWVPTHVQVTVLRGKGLRAKGKHGTSDVYTIIQVGKEKYSTCVLEKTTAPEWKEECCFELLPGVLEQVGDGGSYPPGSSDLVLTVMHRALMGLDVFLGQAVIPLDKVFQDRICMKNEWYKLNSKTGKKEKERGDIQVTVQFTKNNLTASMYDLSLGKDKPRSTFGKIKDRIKGKKRSSKDSDEDSASTIVGGYGPVSRMRNRLPSDGGGEEDYEDDEGGEGRRSKMRNFFLRGKLRKSSDTRSSTSLGSESSESSSRGGSLSPTAGISVVVSDLSNSPSNSSNFTADSPDHTAESSPKLASYTCEFTDESGEINIPVPQPVCINGSHVYNTILDPCPGNPVVPFDPLALVKKNLPLSQSLQNLSQRREELPVLLPKGPAADGRRWSFDKAGEEEKVVIAAALEQAGQGMGEGAREESDRDSQGRKRSRDCLDESEQASNSDSGPGEKHKGWFGLKDNHNKPSPVVSPSSGPHLTPHTPGLTPRTPGLTPHTPGLTPLTPGLLSWGPPHLPVDPNSLGTSLHHTNPFSPSPPPMSPSNPFLSLLQCNPFYEELLADQALNLNSAQPHLPPCCSSFTSRISVAPQTWSTNPNPIPILPLTQDCTNTGMKEQRPFLKPPPEEKSVNTKDKEEEEAVKTSQRPLPKTETVPSADTPLCEEDMSYTKAETASFHSATGSDNMAALDLMGEFSDDRCWAALDDVIQSDTLDRATSHLGAMCVDKEKTTSSEARIDWPISMDIKSYNSELSDALLHSFSSQAHSPLKTFQSSTGTSSGEKVNEDIKDYKSEDQYSEHPRVESVVVQRSLSEEHPLQRSLSEGTRMNSVEDLTPSFGSDPGVVTLGSLSFVQQHDTSDLLAASSSFFSAPSSLTAESNTSSCPALSSLPAPPPATVRSSVSTVSAAPLFSTAQPVIGASHAGMPQETHPPANQQISPHPVKPLTPEERRRAELSEGRSVLDKLKSSIHPGWSSQPTEQQPEKKKSLTEGAGPYYHLTHSELVALLRQREADLHRQRAEFDQQGALLAKREAELKKMKPQVRDLEDYIDTLLVRIMEQTPTILQVGTKLK